MIPIAAPQIGEAERAAVLAVLDSGQLAQGPKVHEFETRFAEWAQVPHAVALSSGTAALHVALLAHGLGPGDEVITTPFSFVASANCALYVGATPVFADIEPDYFTLDPDQVARKITARTRAIVAVHLYGQPCNMPALADLAAKHGLILIEDACQSHGARLNGQPVGAWGTACYSFYPTKNMTTLEGGMLTTSDPAIAQRARSLREHGSQQRYRHEILGYNLRMTDVQAAIGVTQLEKLDCWNEQRQANAAYLDQGLAGLEAVVTPRVRPGASHVFHQYTLRVRDRDRVAEGLRQQGVGVGIHYPLPIHQQPLYRELGYVDEMPQAERACQEVLSLPVHTKLGQSDLDYVIETLWKLYA